ncbi:VirK/YbjX family protein [Yersinia ruckeri]|uniref:Putative virulence factor n=1 Tax=Yersinia ruckeri TaxID=29486 RepID=A0A380QLH7_YERRU|nr:VirK/YbjX family protein [Yersinia ruckeri]KGA49354.1 hypothetical protein DJ39_1095 [Yersinia ruckeri ATCC 29473]MCW6609478.1 VirK/YbjX family protein [Yersinia ruckeri]MCW6616617.1 VirK/YbjX family protein [Yersinia ruckeri]MCW6619349.1 VirK/YbjX family protein [Yersinia ruckeri]MCW6626079.1 VirK/YbjX family protein [Yersinia ruckeri]
MYLLNASSANVGQVNRWQLISRLVKGDANLPGSWHKPIFRWKSLARTLVFPQVTLGLLSELAGNPQLGTLLQSQPDFPCKLHRPYLSANLTKRQGLQAIKDHYQLVNELMPTSLGLGYIQGSPFKLADVTGRHEQVFSLFLGTLPSLNKEGEATLMFANPQGEILALLTFNLMMYRQEKTLFIGGLQGAASQIPHEKIQISTKECHGLFPKRLLLEAAYCLAKSMGISQIIAVGNSTHIYQNWRYRRQKKDKLHANYDDFWQSLGGKKADDGYYALPTRIARKVIEDIASKKRAEYRRRYQLLDQLETGIAAHFQHAAITPTLTANPPVHEPTKPRGKTSFSELEVPHSLPKSQTEWQPQ